MIWAIWSWDLYQYIRYCRLCKYWVVVVTVKYCSWKYCSVWYLKYCSLENSSSTDPPTWVIVVRDDLSSRPRWLELPRRACLSCPHSQASSWAEGQIRAWWEPWWKYLRGCASYWSRESQRLHSEPFLCWSGIELRCIGSLGKWSALCRVCLLECYRRSI